MYLNLVQIAESFGVSETVVEDWIRRESLPHIVERGRFLFDREQVAGWAAARGLATQVGFLANTNPAFSTGWRLEPLLRRGGIWRDVKPPAVPDVFEQIVSRLPGTTASVRQLVAHRLRADGGVTMAPVGGGFALPHPSARIALGRDAGAVALLFLRPPFPLPEQVPDGLPITQMLFFIAPSPRAHLDLLGRLSRMLARSAVPELIVSGASDEDIYFAMAAADSKVGIAAGREVGA